MTTTREKCTIDGNNGVKLDACLFKPPSTSTSTSTCNNNNNNNNIAVVLVHPYSILGGCQALMKGIARNLADLGFPSLIFNIRGVGKSTGRPSLTGFSEVYDLVSICNGLSLSFNSYL